MLKTILITGLDGCGKSTLFSKLKERKPAHVALINLPHIDEHSLPATSVLKTKAQLLNQMSREADEANWSDLKALALLGAMLLYGQLVQEIATPLTRVLIVERHPLIDPLIYAKFYGERISSGLERLDYYNATYSDLLAFIVSLLPIESKGNYAGEIFHFIGAAFKNGTLSEIFKAALPDKIFFLKADPALLLSRISARKVAEPHEQLPVLTLLDKTYDSLFAGIPERVEYIDASHFEQLDKFYDTLMEDISKNN
ncbi:hypothetical protein [Chitinophaga sp.]|uniref:hypothetical protein n=1 Tax=Chitinophaga sp. TaxID=1869181 RepID=UPI0031DDD8CF